MQRVEPQFSREAYGRPCAAVLSVIGALASPSPNAKYSALDILNVALSQCHANDFVATTVRAMRKRGVKTMTGQRFLQLLGKRDPDETLEICGDMLEAAVKMLAEAGRLKGNLVLAVDEHGIPYYGKKRYGTKDGKKKDGTNWFECYITIQVVSGKSPVTLSVYRIAAGESQTHYLSALIENARRLGANIDVLLLDRGLNSAANIREMECQGVRYITPKSGDPTVHRAMEAAKVDPGKTVREYAITAKDCTTVTPTMAIVPKKIKPCRAKCGECKRCKPVLMKDKYVAFPTNVTVDSPKKLLKHVPKKYRARWGIETGYRSMESIRVKTKSPNTSARLFLFYFTAVVVNLWLYCKAVQTPYWGPSPVMPLIDYVDCLWLHVTRGGPP